jgi:hypothetical protein
MILGFIGTLFVVIIVVVILAVIGLMSVLRKVL